MIRLALIGVGKFGKNYLRILQDMPGVELAAVAVISKNSLKSVAVSDLVQKTINAEDIFGNFEIDAVVIATPTKTHVALASSALKQGKHVLLEKPMTATLKEAEELARIAEKSGKILMIGHQYCYNDHIRFLKQKLTGGFFGKIHYIYAEHFYTKPLFGKVGCFWETATHELAILDYLFDEFSIKRKMSRFEDFFGKDRDDFANVSFSLYSKSYSQILENINIRDYAESFPVTISTSWCAPEKVRKFTIVGEKGAAIFDEVRDTKNPLMLYKIDDEDFGYKEISIDVPNAGEPLRNELEHFIECISKKRRSLTDYRHGLRVTKYLNAIMSS